MRRFSVAVVKRQRSRRKKRRGEMMNEGGKGITSVRECVMNI